jgi:hypothetical protein
MVDTDTTDTCSAQIRNQSKKWSARPASRCVRRLPQRSLLVVLFKLRRPPLELQLQLQPTLMKELLFFLCPISCNSTIAGSGCAAGTSSALGSVCAGGDCRTLALALALCKTSSAKEKITRENCNIITARDTCLSFCDR